MTFFKIAFLFCVGLPLLLTGVSLASDITRSQVRALQLKLNANGYDAGIADGLSGKRTKDAARRLLLDRGLNAEKGNELSQAFALLTDNKLSAKNIAERFNIKGIQLGQTMTKREGFEKIVPPIKIPGARPVFMKRESDGTTLAFLTVDDNITGKVVAVAEKRCVLRTGGCWEGENEAESEKQIYNRYLEKFGRADFDLTISLGIGSRLGLVWAEKPVGKDQCGINIVRGQHVGDYYYNSEKFFRLWPPFLKADCGLVAILNASEGSLMVWDSAFFNTFYDRLE